VPSVTLNLPGPRALRRAGSLPAGRR
jgi:hypothetical protein